MIRQVYDDLGGLASEFSNARPGGFDLAFDTGDGPVVVELDEEQHFNRYRATTLLRPWAADLPWTDDYLSYCRQYETEMTRSWMSGRRWTNDSAPRFFGPPSPPGDFSAVGSPRWRQRAFYDSVKDLLPEVRLARVSVHDPIAEHSMNRVLRNVDLTAAPEVLTLVTSRTHDWPAPSHEVPRS